jgi:hypothetical protein
MAIGFFDGDKQNASPETIKRKRELVARLMQGRAPRNVGEGLNAIGKGLQAAVLGSRADAMEQANEAERSRLMSGLFGGGAPMAAVGGAPVATGSATGSAAVSGNVGRGPAAFQEIGPRIKSDLMRDFQLSPEQAAGFVGNLAHESGGFGTLQEIKPMIPGSRGGFGYAQWTGPRRRQFESWSAQNNLDPSSYEANYGFLKHELANTPEGRVLDRLRQTNDPTQATRIVSDVFLRPGIPGMGSREKWTQRALGFSQQPQMASNMPVISPGPGAAPMPLARQNVQTAPMPNAGPQSNEGLSQDGAGELQAGGSGLMAKPAIYRGQLNDVPSGDLMQRGPMPALPPGFDLSSLVTPAGQPSGAMAQGIAENEDQTRMMEAQMAAEQGLPYAGNEPALSNQGDVYSPVPMGFGRNPFLPREPDAMAQAPAPMSPQMDRATFDQVTAGLPQRAPAFTREQSGIAPSWAGNAEIVAPGAQEVSGPRQVVAPIPPQRPADLAQQPQRQPLPVDMGGENGISPMQFIESEFARREGRPDPRLAVGAPGQIYNPFVQRPPEAPQMPAGGGSVPGDAQPAPMGGAPAAQAQAQAQAQSATRPGMYDERWLIAVAQSPATSQYSQWALKTLGEQRALVQAEQQNRRVAQDLNIPESLAGNQAAVAARVQQMYAKPESATTDQRELEQVNRERQNANLPALRMDEWKTQKARAGATSIVNDLTGGSSKQVFDALKERAEAAQTAANGLNALREARKAVTDGGFFGAGADQRLGFAKIGALLGFEDGRITNTETFRSAIAPQVAAVMKATVGSTQISNQDREFAEKAAGGSIALDDKSINRLLNIMERGSNDIISRHQKQLDAVYPEGPDGKFARERALFGVQAPAAPTQTGPARPSSKAEFDALPSGSTFIAPDGTTRRKP